MVDTEVLQEDPHCTSDICWRLWRNQQANYNLCLRGWKERHKGLQRRFSILRRKTEIQNGHEAPKATGSESPLCHIHLLLWMTVLLWNRNVCLFILHLWRHLFHIVLSLFLFVCQHLASTHFKWYFSVNTKQGLTRQPSSGLLAFICQFWLANSIYYTGTQVRMSVRTWQVCVGTQ